MAFSESDIRAAWEAQQAPQQQAAPQQPAPQMQMPQFSESDIKAAWEAQQPTFASEAKAVAGQGVRGALDLAGFVTDVMKAPGVLYMNQVQGKDVPYFDTGARLRGIADQVLPEKPETTAGRYAGRAAEFAPSGAIGKGAAAARYGSALLGGLGAQYAKEAGFGAGGELVASMIGGVAPGAAQGMVQGAVRGGRGVLAAVRPDRAKSIAARELQTVVGGQKQAAIDALKSFVPQNKLEKLATAAEASGDPMLSHIENDLGRTFDPMKERIANRTQEIETLKTAMLEGGLPSEALAASNSTRGDIIRAALESNKGKAKAVSQQLYAAVDPENTTKLPIAPIKAAIGDAKDKYIGAAGEPLSGRASALVKAIDGLNKPKEPEASLLLDQFGAAISKGEQAAPQTATIGELAKLTSRAGDVAGQLGQQNKNQARAVVVSIRDAIKGVEDAAIASGEGLSATQLETLKKARSAWRNLKGVFETGAAGAVTKTDEFGRYKAEAETVMQSFIKSDRTAEQFVRATKKQPEAVAAMRAYLASTARDAKPGQFRRLLATKSTQLKIILGEKHYNDIQDVASFLQRQETVTKNWKLPSKGQSNTAQKTTIVGIVERVDRELGPIAFLADVKGGRIGASVVGAAGGSAFAGWLGAALGSAVGAKAQQMTEKTVLAFRERVFNHIQEAALDPKYAAELLQMKAPAQIESMATEILKGAVAGMGRGAATTGMQNFNAKASASFSAPSAQPVQREQPKGTDQLVQALTGKKETKSDPLARAMMMVESGGDRYAVSPKGAQGLYQIMPEVGKEYHKRLGLPGSWNPWDEEQQTKVYNAFMGDLKKKYSDQRVALAGFNYGETKLDKAIKRAGSERWEDVYRFLPNETRAYVPKIARNLENQG